MFIAIFAVVFVLSLTSLLGIMAARTAALFFALFLVVGVRANDAPHTGLLPGVGTPEHISHHDDDVDPPTPPPKPLPACADSNNCFDCFLQQVRRAATMLPSRVQSAFAWLPTPTALTALS